MGRKRIRTRKYIHFYIASLIFLSLCSCSVLEKAKIRMMPQEISHQYLLHSQELLAKGDYEGALRENQKVLSLSAHKPPEDEALFNIGLIYAHAGNSQKDYGKSLSFFKRLMKDYPQSTLFEQARAWEMMLQENEKLNHTINKLNNENEKLNQVIEESKKVDIAIEEKKKKKGK
jgi:tetratricopeptide (TPR) repeat protein